MSRYHSVKQRALLEIKKNETLFRVVKMILGKNKKSLKRSVTNKVELIAPGKVVQDKLIGPEKIIQPKLVKPVKGGLIDKCEEQNKILEEFIFKFRLRNYTSAADLISRLSLIDLNDKHKLDVIQCMLSADRGVEADIVLGSLIDKLQTDKSGLPYLGGVADKVYVSGYEYGRKIKIWNELRSLSGDDDRGRKNNRQLDWLEFRLRNEREISVDPLSYIYIKQRDIGALKDHARFLSALKSHGYDQIIKEILLQLYESSQFSDLFTLRSFLIFWPQWFEGRSIAEKIPDKFKSELSLLVALHGNYKEYPEFFDMYHECLEIQTKKYWNSNLFEKDAILRTFLRLDFLELVQDLVFADDLPGEILPAYIARGFKYFDADDYHSSRSCFLHVLEQDPSDGLAASGLRLAYPRTGHDMRAILGLRDRIGYGIKSAGRIGLRPLGSELTIAELMSGNYVAGLYSKRKSRHWLKLESFYGGKFLNYKEFQRFNLRNKKLFVIGDEGVGDEIRTAQFYSELSERFESVTISCDPRLVNIFSKSFPRINFIPVRRFRKGVSEPGVEEQARLNGFDEKIASYLTEECRAYLDSADYITFGQNLFFNHFTGNLPRPPKGPYLDWVGGSDGLNKRKEPLRVGLLWRSHFKSRMRDFMYLSLEDFLPLTDIQNIELWSVQHCIDDEEIELCRAHGIKLIENVDLFNDFEGLSSCLQNMDLLIGISSVPIELGAALGTEVWMLGFSPENYYLRTAGGKDPHDRYTLNSTVIAPPWIDFSEPRDDCVRQVFDEVRKKLGEKVSMSKSA